MTPTGTPFARSGSATVERRPSASASSRRTSPEASVMSAFHTGTRDIHAIPGRPSPTSWASQSPARMKRSSRTSGRRPGGMAAQTLVVAPCATARRRPSPARRRGCSSSAGPASSRLSIVVSARITPLLGGDVLLRATLVGDVAHDAHEPGREAVPAADRADLDLGPALGAGGGQIAVRVTERDALAGSSAARRRARGRHGRRGARTPTTGRPSEASTAKPVAAVHALGEVRPAACGVGLEHAVRRCSRRRGGDAPRSAQAALGVAEGGQVGVDDHRAEAFAVGPGDRPAAREQPAATLGGLDDASRRRADLLAAQRTQQRCLVRAERAAVGVVQAEGLGPFERVQIVVDGRAVERVQPAVGVGDEHALAQLVEHGLRGTRAALRASGAAPALRRCRARRSRRA